MTKKRTYAGLKRFAALMACVLVMVVAAFGPFYPASAAEGDSAEESYSYALRLLVKAGAEDIRTEDAALGEYDGVYLLGFVDEEALAAAEEHYAAVAEWCERDIPVGASEGEAPEGDPVPVGAEDNALALLDGAEAESMDAPGGKPLVALVDTGAPADAAVVGAVSVISDDAADLNGHATSVLDAMKQQDSDVQVLAIKALNDEGIGSASSVYAAIEYAVSAGADIINLSLAGRASYGNAAIADAVNDALAAGIVVVASAGNGGYDASAFTPANVPGVVTVGACDEEGNPLEASNRGEVVDYYVRADSTSLAAAYVAGWLSADGAGEGWQDRLMESPLVSIDSSAEEGEEVDEGLPDDIVAAGTGTHRLSGGTGGHDCVYSTDKNYYLDSAKTKRMTSSSNAVSIPKNGNYVFQGYWSDTSQGTRNINYKGFITRTSSQNNTTAWYARWNQLVLDDNGGSGGQGYLYPLRSENEMYRDAALTVLMTSSQNPVPVPTRPGYIFDGYYASTTGNTQRIDQNGYFTSKASTVTTGATRTNRARTNTLYAHWKEAPWTITLDKQGGTGGENQIFLTNGRGGISGKYHDIDHNRPISSSSPVSAPSKPYQTFDGYYRSAYAGSPQLINASGVPTGSFTNDYFTNNATIYAAWKGLKITLHKESGTGGESGPLYEMYNERFSTNQYGSNAVSRINTPRRNNYTFGGYFTGKNGSGTQIIDSSGNIVVSNTYFRAAADIYAYWISDSYVITLDNEGADIQSGSPAVYEAYNVGVYLDSALANLMTLTQNPITLPQKSHYNFGGYYTGKRGAGTQRIDANGYLTSSFSSRVYTEDKTIYARWLPLVITLDDQGGSGGSGAIYEDWGNGIYRKQSLTEQMSTTQRPVRVPTKRYYVFKGYFTQPGGAGTRIVDESGYLASGVSASYFDDNATIYACWESKLSFPVTGGEGLDEPLLWAAVLAMLCGGVVVVRRRLLAVPSADGRAHRGAHTQRGLHVRLGKRPDKWPDVMRASGKRAFRKGPRHGR